MSVNKFIAAKRSFQDNVMILSNTRSDLNRAEQEYDAAVHNPAADSFIDEIQNKLDKLEFREIKMKTEVERDYNKLYSAFKSLSANEKEQYFGELIAAQSALENLNAADTASVMMGKVADRSSITHNQFIKIQRIHGTQIKNIAKNANKIATKTKKRAKGRIKTKNK